MPLDGVGNYPQMSNIRGENAPERKGLAFWHPDAGIVDCRLSVAIRVICIECVVLALCLSDRVRVPECHCICV